VIKVLKGEEGKLRGRERRNVVGMKVRKITPENRNTTLTHRYHGQ
jgi:hypothetical protein